MASDTTRHSRRRKVGNRASKMTLVGAAFLVLVLSVLPSMVSGMGVISIDYGTAFMKAALVKPGMPFDVVLSRDSKRKVPSVVGWKKHERLFGADAENAAGRLPDDVYAGMKLLLGRSYDNATVLERQSQLYGTHLVPATQRPEAIAVQRPLKTQDDVPIVYSVEEIVGMQLSHMKQLAEATAREEVKVTYPGNIGTFGGLDVVVTVPGYYTAQERQAIYDASQLAGMKPRLVSDGAAAATSYALTRSFPKTERHLFYDSGAGSTRATIVEFSTQQVQADSVINIGSTQKEATVIEVLSLGWDREAGGMALDLIIRDILADKFQVTPAGQKLEKPVRENARAMAKLLKEASRVKQILSANAIASSGVEGLAEDRDWRGKVERDEFEAAVKAAGLVPRFAQPIKDALARANLKFSDLDSVVMVGGNTRVPLVQAALREEAGVPEDKLAQNVNADEASVMGAAFYGASFNPQFRMKDIRAYDGNPYPILLREGGAQEVLFGQGSFKEDVVVKQYGSSIQEDFILQLEYAPDSASIVEGFSQDLQQFNISGISAVLEELKANGDISGVETDLNVTIVSKPLGTFSVQSATLNVKPKVKTNLAGALKGFFGVGGSEQDDVEEEDASATNDTEADQTKPKKTKKPQEAKDKLVRLTTEVYPLGNFHPLSQNEVKKSKDLLYVLDKDNERRIAREEARNVLEGYIYRIRDLLEDSQFKSASKKTEREKIQQKTDQLSSYLTTEGDNAEISKLKLRRADLEGLVKPIELRLREAEIREQGSKSFSSALADAQAFVEEAQSNLTQALAEQTSSKYSKTELDTLQNSLQKDKKWFEEGTALQKKKKIDEDPVILVEDMQKRQRKFGETIRKMRRRKIAKTRPPKKTTTQKEKVDAEQRAAEDEPPTGTKEQEVPPEPEAAESSEAEHKKTAPSHEEL